MLPRVSPEPPAGVAHALQASLGTAGSPRAGGGGPPPPQPRPSHHPVQTAQGSRGMPSLAVGGMSDRPPRRPPRGHWAAGGPAPALRGPRWSGPRWSKKPNGAGLLLTQDRGQLARGRRYSPCPSRASFQRNQGTASVPPKRPVGGEGGDRAVAVVGPPRTGRGTAPLGGPAPSHHLFRWQHAVSPPALVTNRSLPKSGRSLHKQ